LIKREIMGGIHCSWDYTDQETLLVGTSDVPVAGRNRSVRMEMVLTESLLCCDDLASRCCTRLKVYKPRYISLGLAVMLIMKGNLTKLI